MLQKAMSNHIHVHVLEISPKMITEFKIVLVLFFLSTDISLRYFYVIVVSRIY